jgi:hypothetical protein
MSRNTQRAVPIAAAVAVGTLIVGAVAASAGEGSVAAAEPAAGGHGGAGHGAAGLVEPLSATCADSKLPPHDGFQIGPACVSTQFGEVPAAEDVPQLLITDSPDRVAVGQAFQIKVSTRNLVRDRFLAAAQGGYYVERSILNEQGLVRGHFHTACRVLGNTDQAPQPDRQDVFVATEDNGGGAAPDTVTVQIPGLPAAGEAQCTTWAGDGSHRIPMQVFANQMPAVDSVRIQVTSSKKAGTGSEGKAGQGTKASQPTQSGQATKTAEAPQPTKSSRSTDTAQQTDTAHVRTSGVDRAGGLGLHQRSGWSGGWRRVAL